MEFLAPGLAWPSLSQCGHLGISLFPSLCSSALLTNNKSLKEKISSYRATIPKCYTNLKDLTNPSRPNSNPKLPLSYNINKHTTDSSTSSITFPVSLGKLNLYVSREITCCIKLPYSFLTAVPTQVPPIQDGKH